MLALLTMIAGEVGAAGVGTVPPHVRALCVVLLRQHLVEEKSGRAPLWPRLGEPMRARVRAG